MAFGDGFGGGLGSRRRQPDLTTPEEQRTFWEGLASTASPLLSNLSTLGFGLEKYGGARALKGLLAGKPQELLSIIPGSDQMEWTNATDRTGGAELLNSWGLLSKKDPDLFSGEGAAGLAADVLLDPLNLLLGGGGALTKLGLSARKAGVVPKTGALRAAGLAGHSEDALKLGRQTLIDAGRLPADPIAAGMASAGAAQNVAGKSLGGNIGLSSLPFGFGERATGVIPWDKVGNTLAKLPLGVGPTLAAGGNVLRGIGRLGSAGFENATKRRVTDLGQDIARAQSAAEPGAKAAGIAEFHGLQDAGLRAGLTKEQLLNETVGESTRRMVEGFSPTGSPQTLAGESALAGRAERDFAKQLAEKQQYRQVSALDDTTVSGQRVGFGPRHTEAELAERTARGVAAEAEKRRQDIFKVGLPTDGPGSMNALMKENLAGRSVGVLANDIRQKYIGFGPAEVQELNMLRAVPPTTTQAAERLTLLDNLWQRSERLAAYKHSLGDIDGKFYPKHFLEETGEQYVRHAVKMSNDAKLHEGLIAGAHRTRLAKDDVSLLDTFREAGLFTGNASLANKVKSGVIDTPMQATMAALFKKTGYQFTPDQALTDLGNLFVTKAEFDDITRVGKAMTAPEWLKPILGFFDSATNLFRAGVTQPFLNYLARNGVSGMAHNAFYGGFDPTAKGVMRLAGPYIAADAWRAGKLIPNANKIPELSHLSAQAASDALHKKIIQWDIAGKGQFEHLAQLPGEAASLRDLIPGFEKTSLVGGFGKAVSPKGWGEYAGKLKAEPSLANLFGTKGVAGATEDTMPLVSYGRSVSTTSDQLNRVSMFIAKKLQGFSDEAARLDVNKAHLNFSNLSEFETAVPRRMIPFYNWSRQNVPTLIKEMFERPGGGMATAFKAVSKARGDKEGFLPQGLGDRIALPIGEEKEGTQRYLSSLGLPMEELGQITDPGQYLLGSLNPYLKAPLEQWTNRQFFSGRELSDLRSRTGAPPGVENYLLNSPLARVASTFGAGGTLLDERKSLGARALNFLTGVKLTDVDMEKARLNAGRQTVREMARQHPNLREFSSVFLPKALKDKASPEELRLAQFFRRMI